MIVARQRVENRCQQAFALDQLVQPLLQAGAVEGFGQIGVGLELQCGHDHGLAALGSDHDEDAVGADQLFVVQLFEHLLPVLALTEVVVVQDDVISGFAAEAESFLAVGGNIDVLGGHLPEHALDR